MANTIGDLYAKYTSQVGETLEEDRYFQYLFEMVQAGENTLQQKNRILHLFRHEIIYCHHDRQVEK